MTYAVVALPPAKKHQSEQSAYDVAAILADKIASIYGDGIPTKSSANHIRKFGCTVLFSELHEARRFSERLNDANFPDCYFRISLNYLSII